MSHYVTSFYVMSRHVMSRHAMSCHVMYLMSRHATPCHVMSYHVMSCHVMWCHVMSRLAPSCHVMSHHVTSYHFKSRGTVTQPTLHCQLTSSTRNQFKLSMTVFVGCPEGCRYHTASAVYDLVFTTTALLKINMLFNFCTDDTSELSYLRLWKGLHYSMWMADKPLFQVCFHWKLSAAAVFFLESLRNFHFLFSVFQFFYLRFHVVKFHYVFICIYVLYWFDGLLLYVETEYYYN